jgi:ATP/maltotriose-dependent transcriptional regulator MalT
MWAESLYYGSVPVDAAALECAALLEEAPDRMTEANILVVLAALKAAVGAVGDGRPLLSHSRDLFDELGNTLGLHTVWAPLAMEFEIFAGDPGGAEHIGRASFDALSAIENRAYASTLAAQLSALAVDRGDADAAEALVDFAEEHAIATDVLVQFLWRVGRSGVALSHGDVATAEQFARDAVALSEHTDALRDRARAHAALAAVLDARGLPAEADSERSTAEQLLREKGIQALSTREGASSAPSR